MPERNGWSASSGACVGAFFACLFLQSACVRARTSAPPSVKVRAHAEPDLVIPDSDAAAHAESEAPEPLSAQKKPSAAVRGRAPTSDPSLPGDLKWPLRGVLYSRFGRNGREVHDGIDLAAPLGTPIKAARGGTVLYAGEQKGYGLIAIIEHANGLTTLYAHNRDLKVTTGQRVREGQVIATVGESGRTTGPHLHFEVRRDGVPVDPLDHLGPIPR
jgi:murein DD-endopeptidase MepM/ murein hydrolase activator NlpD